MTDKITEYIKTYWPIFTAILTALVVMIVAFVRIETHTSQIKEQLGQLTSIEHLQDVGKALGQIDTNAKLLEDMDERLKALETAK